MRQAQEDRDLFVDGVVGRETAISLGVWPDEESFVVRTPPPARRRRRSRWATRCRRSRRAGSDAPAAAGRTRAAGRRIVYDRPASVSGPSTRTDNIIRSWLVSGSKYSNEIPGTHEVYSRSDVSTAWNGKAYLPKMVR